MHTAEGPSRWQERKEAKRQMYLMSTEKQVRLGERKDLKASMSSIGTASQCQKCFQTGHWAYECKNERVYISRAQQLKNPKLRMKLSISIDNAYAQEVAKDNGSLLSNGLDCSSAESDLSYSSSSDSEEEKRRRKKKKTMKQRKKIHRRSSSVSESSNSESDLEDRSSRKKSRRNSRRC